MLLIHRSIFKELVSSFLLSILFLNFTLMTEELMKLSRLLSVVGASIVDISEIILYLQPQILIFTIPMAMLFSVLLTYGRMNADNELIMLRVSGMSFRNISRPVAYLGIGCFAVSLAMSFFLSPLASGMLRAKVSEVLTTRAPMAIEEGVFNTSFKGIVMLVKGKMSPNHLYDIYIIDERTKNKQKIIFAKEGTIVPEKESISFSLTNGHIYIIKNNMFTEITFGKYYFKIDPSVEPAKKRRNELTPLELLKESGKVQGGQMRFLLEFHRRLSMPAICLIIMILGPALSLMAGKSGRLGGLTVGLSVFAAYYFFMLYGENMAKLGKLPHFVGAWLPFVILGAFSLFVFERVNKK